MEEIELNADQIEQIKRVTGVDVTMPYEKLECKDPDMSWKDFKAFIHNQPEDAVFGVHSDENGNYVGNRVLYYDFITNAPYRVYGMGTPDPLWVVLLDQLQLSVSGKSGTQFFPFSKEKVLYLIERVDEIMHLADTGSEKKAPWRPSYLAMKRDGKYVLRPYVRIHKEEYIEQITEAGYYAQSDSVLRECLLCLLFIYYPEYYDIQGTCLIKHEPDDVESEILSALKGTKSEKINFFHFKF